MTSRMLYFENATPEADFERAANDLVFYGAYGIVIRMQVEIAISLEVLLNELAMLIPEGITYPLIPEEP